MKRTKIDVPDYGINPFTIPLVVNANSVVSSKGNEVHSELVEAMPYAKRFRDVRSREITSKLGLMGYRMLEYIMHRIEYGSDIISVTPAQFMDYAEVKSAKSFYNGINELHKLSVICPVSGHKGKYWINPAILFVGDRVKAFPENVVIKRTIKKK